jgi:hypothetical protein
MSSHPLVKAALAIYPAQPEREAWAITMAEQAENLLNIARRVGPATSDADAEGVLRAAAKSVLVAQREYATAESLRWAEAAIRELEALARAKFGPSQVIISLGYMPLPAPASGARPRGRLLGNPL